MRAYSLTLLAKADLFDVWSYIAADSVEAAERVEQAIYDACAFVAEAPMRGHTRRDLTSRPVRFWTLVRYPNYTIAYRPTRRHFRSSPSCTGKKCPAHSEVSVANP